MTIIVRLLLLAAVAFAAASINGVSSVSEVVRGIDFGYQGDALAELMGVQLTDCTRLYIDRLRRAFDKIYKIDDYEIRKQTVSLLFEGSELFLDSCKHMLNEFLRDSLSSIPPWEELWLNEVGGLPDNENLDPSSNAQLFSKFLSRANIKSSEDLAYQDLFDIGNENNQHNRRSDVVTGICSAFEEPKYNVMTHILSAEMKLIELGIEEYKNIEPVGLVGKFWKLRNLCSHLKKLSLTDADFFRLKRSVEIIESFEAQVSLEKCTNTKLEGIESLDRLLGTFLENVKSDFVRNEIRSIVTPIRINAVFSRCLDTFKAKIVDNLADGEFKYATTILNAPDWMNLVSRQVQICEPQNLKELLKKGYTKNDLRRQPRPVPQNWGCAAASANNPDYRGPTLVDVFNPVANSNLAQTLKDAKCKDSLCFRLIKQTFNKSICSMINDINAEPLSIHSTLVRMFKKYKELVKLEATTDLIQQMLTANVELNVGKFFLLSTFCDIVNK